MCSLLLVDSVDLSLATNPSRKCQRYSLEFLKLVFMSTLSNKTMIMHLCRRVFSKDAMKATKMKDHFQRIHSNDKKMF